jgi:multidrug efflux pump subunit AcrA (membrane-fusion protein)
MRINMTQYIQRAPARIGSAIWVLVLTLAVGATGCSGAEARAQGGGGPQGMPPMPVDVDTARVQSVVDAVRATGRIEAVHAVELRPDEQGRITAILFQEGQAVAKGTPLIQIDDAMLRAQAARAEAERDLHRLLPRNRPLHRFHSAAFQ